MSLPREGILESGRIHREIALLPTEKVLSCRDWWNAKKDLASRPPNGLVQCRTSCICSYHVFQTLWCSHKSHAISVNIYSTSNKIQHYIFAKICTMFNKDGQLQTIMLIPRVIRLYLFSSNKCWSIYKTVCKAWPRIPWPCKRQQ